MSAHPLASHVDVQRPHERAPDTPPRAYLFGAGRRTGLSRWRRMAALVLLFSTLVLAVTGGVLYFWHAWAAPPLGWPWRVWGNIHSVTSLFFLVGVVTHVILNGGAMLRHLGHRR